MNRFAIFITFFLLGLEISSIFFYFCCCSKHRKFLSKILHFLCTRCMSMRPNWKRLKYVENRNLFWTHINRIRFNFFLYSIFFWMLCWLGLLDGKWWIGWCTGVKSLVVAEPWISRIVGAFVLRRRNQGKCKLNTCFYIESGQKGSECEMRFSEPLGKSVFGEHSQRIEITNFSN